MIVHALSVLSVQAQVSTYRFLSKNDISAVVALKKHSVLRVRSAMRRDWTPRNPQKVLKISMFLAIFTYDGCSPTPSNAQEAVLEPLRAIWSHFGVILGSFWGHLGANFLDQSCGNDWSRNFEGIWEPFGNHLEQFW